PGPKRARVQPAPAPCHRTLPNPGVNEIHAPEALAACRASSYQPGPRQGGGLPRVCHRPLFPLPRPGSWDRLIPGAPAPTERELPMTLIAGLAMIALALVAILRRVDVRLALLLAALALGVLGGNPMAVVRKFLVTLADEKFVVPICCAMGFAYVLRHTG